MILELVLLEKENSIQREGHVMSTKVISGGIASEYDDQILWIENTEVGANAAQARSLHLTMFTM